MAANSRNRPGRPEGADAMGLRAVYAHIAHLAAGSGNAKGEAPASALTSAVPTPARKPAAAKRRAPARRRVRR
jgi:hypothetical protein